MTDVVRLAQAAVAVFGRQHVHSRTREVTFTQQEIEFEWTIKAGRSLSMQKVVK